MPSTKRNRLVTGAGVLAGALLLAGCSVTSPHTITTPYPASDGVLANLGTTGVSLRNFLVVGTAKGAPASVIGSVINDSDSTAKVSLMTDLGESAQPKQTIVTIPAHGVVAIGPQQPTQMTIPDLPVIPGADTGLSAQILNGGTTNLQVPVVPATNEYTNLTPPPTTAAPTPTTTGKGKNKTNATPSSSATDDSTPTPTSTNS